MTFRLQSWRLNQARGSTSKLTCVTVGQKPQWLNVWDHKAACCSVTQWCLTLWDPMDCSTPGLPVPHHLPEFAQVHVQWISDAIKPSYPLMPSSALHLSQHQGLFQRVVCLHQMTKILELQLQHQSVFSISEYSGLISLMIDCFDLLSV